MFRQSHFGFPIGPVLVAHEAQDGQQLRLRELVFTERRAITRHSGGWLRPRPPARIAPNPLPPWLVAGFAGAHRSITQFATASARWNLGSQQSQDLFELSGTALVRCQAASETRVRKLMRMSMAVKGLS